MFKKIISAVFFMFFSLCMSMNFISAKASEVDYSFLNSIRDFSLVDDYMDYDLQFSTELWGRKYYVYGNFSNVNTPNSTLVNTYNMCTDFPQEVLRYFEESSWTAFHNITIVGPATAKYNCHSYAWYSQSFDNDMWMDNPESYILDFSYEEVNIPVPGDIICYIANDGTFLHSGIVLSYNQNVVPNNICEDSNRVYEESKWGYSGVFRHYGDNCSYAYQASEIRYFHRHTVHKYVNHYCYCGAYTATHDFHGPYTILNSSQHQARCACGQIQVQNHDYHDSYLWLNNFQHRAYCVCKHDMKQPHVVSSSSFSHGEQFAYCLLCDGLANIGFINSLNNALFISKNNSYILDNGIIVLSDEDFKLYINGNLDLNYIGEEL